MSQEKTQNIKVADTLGNPAPMALLGFGMTTILLNIHNAGFSPLNATIIAMGVCYGGLAQIIGGVMEFKKGNTFGGTAFTSYGFFWLSLVLIWWNPIGEKATGADMAAYLGLWGLFTFFMFIKTVKSSNRITQLVFGTLTLLFLLLVLDNATGSETIKHMAGWVGLVCGSLACYDAVAQILGPDHK